MHQRRPLEAEAAQEVMKHVARLWGFEVRLESVNDQGEVKHSYSCQVADVENFGT